MLNLNCVICAELFTATDDVHVTSCGHMFHFTCLKQWLQRSKTCPQCRNKCTDRNIFRLYFNLANLDISRIDVGSLQEQLENANLQLKMKEKELKKAEDQIKGSKETQKKCMKTIASLEKEVKSHDFVVLNYAEKLKLLQDQVKMLESTRKEVATLKAQIESMNGINTLLTSSMNEAEKLLKNESDPKILSVWITTLKRELRVCEHKRNDVRNQLKAVQNDLRKEIDLKRSQEERISQLESENYNLLEKIKSLEDNNNNEPAYKSTNNSTIGLNTAQFSPSLSLKKDKRFTISPTVKDNIKKIEDSSSPYLNIKSSSVGMSTLFKRNNENPACSNVGPTVKIKTLKVSPAKRGPNTTSGTLRKAKSDLTETYTILKKPRLHAGSSSKIVSMKPLGPNFVFNGFGGSERADPFAENRDDDVAMAGEKTADLAGVSSSKSSINSRLKSGGLRNFKINRND